jgi:hypothetical protein
MIFTRPFENAMIRATGKIMDAKHFSSSVSPVVLVKKVNKSMISQLCLLLPAGFEGYMMEW